MDAAVVAALVAAGATLLVGLGGAVLGKRWGLPGLGREVQAQQAQLIATLQAELAEVRRQRDEDAERISELEDCQKNIATLESRLRRAEAEVLDLYRKMGSRPPRRP